MLISAFYHFFVFDRRFLPFWQLHVAPQTNKCSRQLAFHKLSAGYDEVSPTSSHKENSSSLLNQLANLPGFNPLKARIVKQYAKTPEEILPTAVEKSLPWRRDRSTYNFGMCTNKSINNCSLMDDQRFMLSAPRLSYILCFLLYSIGAFLVI